VTIETYLLPAGHALPEGITEGPGEQFFVGSLVDGAIARGSLGSAQVDPWLPGGQDDRTAVAGLHVDPYGRLHACGLRTGWMFAYDVASGELVARHRVPAGETLLNDVITTGDWAWVTDSARPVLWRLPLTAEGVGEPELFADLAPAGVAEDGFLNGIVHVADADTLLVAAQGSGELWAVHTDTGAARRVDLGGAEFAADGLVLLGPRTLLGVTNEGETREDVVFGLTVLDLADDLTRGRVVEEVREDRLDSPTTAAAVGDRLLVVCSQLVHQDHTVEPFEVASLPLPRPTPA
jgi:sugar lactone lactonase YvrE